MENNNIKTNFPKNLAYNLHELSNFYKQNVRVIPDRTGVVFGDTSTWRIPAVGILDARTLAIYGTVSLPYGGTGNTLYALKLPRNTSSLIQQLTITCGGVQLCNINDYNLLYNLLFDLEGSDISQTSKRILENPDPSIYAVRGNTVAGGASPIITVLGMDGTTISNRESGRPFCISNFLSFIGSLSTPCLDLADLGSELVITIRWAPTGVLWGTVNTGASPYTVYDTVNNSPAQPQINDLRLTFSRITFDNAVYYDMKNRMMDEGIPIGYYDYWTATGSANGKSQGVNLNFNINTNSLDQCIATFRPANFNTVSSLILHNANSSNSIPRCFNRFLSEPNIGGTLTNAYGDLFNNSLYFLRPGGDLATSQWSINSVNIDPYPLPPAEIFNGNLVALGNNDIDMGSSGLHAGILSLWHFLKYYYCHILSLENLAGDGVFYKSGLSGNASTININYQATFDNQGGTNSTESIIPVIFCRSTKVLIVKKGGLLAVY